MRHIPRKHAANMLRNALQIVIFEVVQFPLVNEKQMPL